MLRLIFVGAFATTMASCTVGAAMLCVDGIIPRPTTESTFDIKVIGSNSEFLTKNKVTCVKYYDSSCSVRGNGYRYKRVFEGAEKFQYLLDNGDKIEFSLPSCETLMSHKTIEPPHFKSRYVDSKTGERINKVFYVYAGIKKGRFAGARGGFYTNFSDPVYLGEIYPMVDVVKTKRTYFNEKDSIKEKQ